MRYTHYSSQWRAWSSQGSSRVELAKFALQIYICGTAQSYWLSKHPPPVTDLSWTVVHDNKFFIWRPRLSQRAAVFCTFCTPPYRMLLTENLKIAWKTGVSLALAFMLSITARTCTTNPGTGSLHFLLYPWSLSTVSNTMTLAVPGPAKAGCAVSNVGQKSFDALLPTTSALLHLTNPVEQARVQAIFLHAFRSWAKRSWCLQALLRWKDVHVLKY